MDFGSIVVDLGRFRSIQVDLGRFRSIQGQFWVKIRSKNFFRLKFINFNHFRSIWAKKNFSKKFHRFRSCVAPSLSCDKSGIVKRPKLAHFPPDPSQIWTEILFLLHLSDEEEKFGNFQNFGLILAKFGFLNKVHNVSNP